MSTPPYLRLPDCAHSSPLHTDRGVFAAHHASPPLHLPVRGSVLLVPGFTGSKEDFIAVLDPLANAGYRVVAVDQRGQYETPGGDDPASYDIDALGEDLLAVAATTAGPTHVVGHSFGGLVARAATIAGPTRVTSLTLLCSGPAGLSGAPAQRLAMLVEALGTFEVADIWAIMSAAAAASGEDVDIDAEVRAFLERRFTSSARVGLVAMATQLLDAVDRGAELAATGVPVLVAYGADDDVWPLAEQAEMARRLGAREAVIDGAGHSPTVQRPVETVQALVDFWSGLR